MVLKYLQKFWYTWVLKEKQKASFSLKGKQRKTIPLPSLLCMPAMVNLCSFYSISSSLPCWWSFTGQPSCLNPFLCCPSLMFRALFCFYRWFILSSAFLVFGFFMEMPFDGFIFGWFIETKNSNEGLLTRLLNHKWQCKGFFKVLLQGHFPLLVFRLCSLFNYLTLKIMWGIYH